MNMPMLKNRFQNEGASPLMPPDIRGHFSHSEMASKYMTLLGCALMFAVLLPNEQAQAQSFPSRPVRIILPYPPGGSTDGPARIITKSLTQQTNQQFVLENRAGASGIIGTEAVAKARPDGYTLLLTVASNTITQALFEYQKKPLPFDMVESFQHIALYGITSSVIVANPKVPVKNLSELVEIAKRRPGSLRYGSPGNGTASHLAMEMLKQHSSIDIVHVPYKGAATASVDLLSGAIDLSIGGVTSSLPHIKAGKLRALAVTTKERSDQLPDIPAVAESYAGYESTGWSALSAPAGISAEIVEKIEHMIQAALQDGKIRESMMGLGTTPTFMGSRELAAKVKADLNRYSEVVRRAKLQID